MSERKWYNESPAPAITYSGRQHIVTVQNWLREREEQEKREKRENQVQLAISK